MVFHNIRRSRGNGHGHGHGPSDLEQGSYGAAGGSLFVDNSTTTVVHQGGGQTLYGAQLYGNDAPHLHYAATRYATEARKLLESLLPSVSSQRNKTVDTGAKMDDAAVRAFTYAAESRRLLASSQALEGADAAMTAARNTFLPPPSRFKFSCALNLITTELGAEDATAAQHFVHYARQAHETYTKSFGGDDRSERCEYECRQLMESHIPNLVDMETGYGASEAKSVNKSTYGDGPNRSRGSMGRTLLLVGVVGTLALLGGSAVMIKRSAYSSGGGGGGGGGGGDGSITAATASDWNDSGGSSASASDATYYTNAPTAAPTAMGTGDYGAGAYDADADGTSSTSTSSNQDNFSLDVSSPDAFVASLRNSPWALAGLATILGLAVMFLAWVLFCRKRDDSDKTVALMDDPSSNVSGNKETEMKAPAAGSDRPVAVAVHPIADVDVDVGGEDGKTVGATGTGEAKAQTRSTGNSTRCDTSSGLGSTQTNQPDPPATTGGAHGVGGGDYRPPRPSPVVVDSAETSSAEVAGSSSTNMHDLSNRVSTIMSQVHSTKGSVAGGGAGGTKVISEPGAAASVSQSSHVDAYGRPLPPLKLQ